MSASSLTRASMSSSFTPMDRAPATSAPPLVPATASITIPASRSTLTTPTWARAFDPPLESASPRA